MKSTNLSITCTLHSSSLTELIKDANNWKVTQPRNVHILSTVFRLRMLKPFFITSDAASHSINRLIFTFSMSPTIRR